MKFLYFSLLPSAVLACTNILVTPGASDDGSSIIAYNADSVSLYGSLYHYPPTKGKGGEMRKVYSWDTGVYLGEITEVDHTYNVVGNGNEAGLVIAETTFGGVEVLSKQTGAILDYGSLIYVTLQRAATARQAIYVISDLMDTYGYASEGESFSISDSKEVWHMEIIGRGNTYGKKGAVWVARKIPDGYIGAHANQARITTFPHNDPENCLYAPDVIDVAIHYGLYGGHRLDESFSFAQAFDPATVINTRTSDARVWSIFSSFADQDGTFQMEYLDYITGRNLQKRMPLFIKPHSSISLTDVMSAMNSHYEGTQLDASRDVGGGLYDSPYRPRPLTWKYGGRTYHNERNIATQRTGWNFVAKIRPHMPSMFAVVLFFATDDSSTSPRVPVYACSREISPPYAGTGPQDGVKAPLLGFDFAKAFWVQNMVSHLAYSRWEDIYPLLREKIDAIHRDFIDEVELVDEVVTKALEELGKDDAIEYATQFGVLAGNKLQQMWLTFYGQLFAQFRDFYRIEPKPEDPLCGCEAIAEGLSEDMKKRIIRETGNHYLVDDEAESREDRQHTFRPRVPKPPLDKPGYPKTLLLNSTLLQ